MKTYLDCIPCFFKQILEASRMTGADEQTQRKALDELAKVMPGIPLTYSPPETGKIVYDLLKNIIKKVVKRDPTTPPQNITPVKPHPIKIEMFIIIIPSLYHPQYFVSIIAFYKFNDI